jgi:hypothetical protein
MVGRLSNGFAPRDVKYPTRIYVSSIAAALRALARERTFAFFDEHLRTLRP